MIEICGLSGQAIKNKKIQLNYFLKNMRTDGLGELKRTKTQTATSGEKYILCRMAPSYDKCIERLEKINTT